MQAPRASTTELCESYFLPVAEAILGSAYQDSANPQKYTRNARRFVHTVVEVVVNAQCAAIKRALAKLDVSEAALQQLREGKVDLIWP